MNAFKCFFPLYLYRSDRWHIRTYVRRSRFYGPETSGVWTYSKQPITNFFGHWTIVTASATSFLFRFEPGLATSLTMWVIPSLKPQKAVSWSFCFWLSRNFLMCSLCFLVLLHGRKLREQKCGCSNLQWDIFFLDKNELFR